MTNPVIHLNNNTFANTDGWGNKLVTVFAFAPAPMTDL